MTYAHVRRIGTLKVSGNCPRFIALIRENSRIHRATPPNMFSGNNS